MEKIILFVYDNKAIKLENNVNVPCSYLDFQNIKALSEVSPQNVEFIFEEFTGTYEITAFRFYDDFLEGFMKKAVI